MKREQVSLESNAGQVGNLVVQTWKDFSDDKGPQWAAAIAYHALLSVFPLLLALVAAAAYFVDPDWAVQQINHLVGKFVPGGEQQITSVIDEAAAASGQVGVISILAFLWSGSKVFSAMRQGLLAAFHIEEEKSFLKRTLVDLTMMVTIGLLFIVALASGFFLDWLVRRVMLPGEGMLLQVVRFVLPALVLLAAFYLTYRFLPGKHIAARAALIGAVFAALAFLVLRPLFIFYVQRFGSYSLVYGPLAVLIILIIWFWIFGMILILGGELVGNLQDAWTAEKRGVDVKVRSEQQNQAKL